ncbi:FGGY-family carbohydrate kinase [Necropsobacter massiliensis]|uniref:FGGY-family carbohydrate kinase n=1 Tax=Necropsobacter massiliensis TaxID=1400001 RepID=UPI000595FE2D|nr:FGGY-family carbohydrate kinase [Necropsobacter massiliensis]
MFYLGIDCGGTFIKAALFDQQGKMYACERKNVEIISDREGYAERDMNRLWQVCADVIRLTVQKSNIAPAQIEAVGISAQGKGAFLLDKNKRPLGRAILSSDQRATAIVKRWRQLAIPEIIYPITSQALWSGHPVSILRWLKENEPERYTKINHVLMSHDYLRFCLTGKLHCEETNISESNFYNMHTGQYDPALTKLFGIEEIFDKLPPIIKGNQIAGTVNLQAAKKTGLKIGTKVVGGLFDVVSTALCANLQDEQTLNVVLGTWTIVSGVSAQFDQTSGLICGRYIQDGKFIIHDDSPTSAGNLDWFINKWENITYSEVNKIIADLPPVSSSILFVPFLYGSNIKLGMQAGFYGLQSYHTQAHLLQAVYEGILFSLMYHLERMKVRFPNTQILRITGGVTKSQVWLQMLADLTGLTLEIPQIEETGCFGAALIAMQGVRKAEKNAMIAQVAMQTIQPSKQNFSLYQEKYQRYQKLVDALSVMA